MTSMRACVDSFLGNTVSIRLQSSSLSWNCSLAGNFAPRTVTRQYRCAGVILTGLRAACSVVIKFAQVEQGTLFDGRQNAMSQCMSGKVQCAHSKRVISQACQ